MEVFNADGGDGSGIAEEEPQCATFCQWPDSPVSRALWGQGVQGVSEVSLGEGKQRQGAESSDQWNTVLIGGFKQRRRR